MANPNQVIGRATVRIDGAIVPTAGDTSLELGGAKREEVQGDYVSGSFRQGATTSSKLEVSILTNSAFSADDFGRITDSTITVEFDTGVTYVIAHAWSEGPPAITTNDGKAKGVLYGQAAQRVS